MRLCKILILASYCLSIAACQSASKKREVQFELDPKNRIIIPATVAEQPALFVFDSGAQRAWVVPRLANNDAIKNPEEISVKTIFGSQLQYSEIEVAKLKIGGQEFKNYKLFTSSTQAANLISINELKGESLTLDFSNRKLVVNSKQPLCKAEQNFLKSRDNVISIRAYYNQERIWLTWDTGADRTLIHQVDSDIFKKEDLKFLRKDEIYEVYSGSKQQVKYYQIKNLELADGAAITEIGLISFAEKTKYLKTTGLIGLDFIKNYNWFFDFKKNKYCAVKN